MTIPMTPPGDGGLDLLPCPLRGEKPDWMRTQDANDGVWWGVECEECSLQLRWFPTQEQAAACWNTRPSTRDAALREEGRVQGLEMAVKWCEAEQSVWAAQVGAYAKGSRNALVAKVRENAMKGAVAELRLLASTPDASQGSAPVAESNRRDK